MREDATIILATLFGDHAVLQRGMSVPVWGWTKPLVRVQVRLGPYAACGMSGDDGKFLVRLPPMDAGGPYELTATSENGGGTATSTDVLVGELWLASGQSNMQWTLSSCGAGYTQDLTEAEDSALRVLTVPNMARLGRQADFQGDWKPCTPAAATAFSAVGYHFAKRLRAELGVPVGIINSSWGGTYIEAWLGRDWLATNPHTAASTAAYEAEVFSPAYWNKLGDILPHSARAPVFPADPGNRGEQVGWARPEAEEDDWKAAILPRTWQFLGHNYSGVFWFRKTVVLPAAWAGKDLALRIGAVDKQDVTYFNGEQVGATGKDFEEQHWNAGRDYRVPGKLVQAGRNTIAVRAYSFVYNGGMIGPETMMSVAPADGSGQPIPLAGEWLYREEHNLGLIVFPTPPTGPGNPNSPYILYDSMIAPLLPCALRGVIWYQGESNADRAAEYRSLLVDLVRCWHRGFGCGDFPFLVVQLANYKDPSDHQPDSTWARLREAQLQTLEEPGVGLAVAIDIGEAFDIHPTNKRDVGGRLAQWALAHTYHKDVAPSGPLYSAMTVEGPRVRLRFEYVCGGLVAKDGILKTFFIAGGDRVFHPAEAVIEGDTVVVESPAVPTPLAVRYAWADNPESCNLYNAANLPASPFRTDCWA